MSHLPHKSHVASMLRCALEDARNELVTLLFLHRLECEAAIGAHRVPGRRSEFASFPVPATVVVLLMVIVAQQLLHNIDLSITPARSFR